MAGGHLEPLHRFLVIFLHAALHKEALVVVGARLAHQAVAEDLAALPLHQLLEICTAATPTCPRGT